MNNASFYDSPLYKAIHSCNTFLVKYYLKTPSEDRLNPKIKHYPFLNKGHQPTDNPLMYTVDYCKENVIEIFDAICEGGEDVTRFPEWLLYYATQGDECDKNIAVMEHIIKVLQNKKIKLNELPESVSALLNAANQNKGKYLKLLLKAGVKGSICYNHPTKHFGFNLVHFLAENNNLTLLKELVDNSLISLKDLIDQESENGETPLSIARNKKFHDFENYLLSQGAKNENILSYRPDFWPQIHAAMIVIARDDNGKPIVVIGKKLLGGQSTYLFPGGLKDLNDKNLRKTAIRECEEETGLPLQKIMDDNGFTETVMFSYHGVYTDKKASHKHAFVLVDLKDKLPVRDLKASDDLVVVEAISLEDILKNNNPILQSNRFLLEVILDNLNNAQELHNLTQTQSERVFYLLELEYFPGKIMKKPLLCNDISALQILIKEGISLNHSYPLNDDESLSLLHLTFRSCNMETITFVLQELLSPPVLFSQQTLYLSQWASDIVEYNANNALDILKSFFFILLIEKNSVLNALETAITLGRIDCIEFINENYQALFKKNVFQTLSPSETTFLNLGIENGNLDIVKKLIMLGTEINPPNLDKEENFNLYTPLMTSIQHNKKDIFNFLIESKVNINDVITNDRAQKLKKQDFSFFLNPSKKNTLKQKNYFLDMDHELKPLKLCAFFVAIRYHRLEMAELLYKDTTFDKKLACEILNMHFEKSYSFRSHLVENFLQNPGESSKKIADILSDLGESDQDLKKHFLDVDPKRTYFYCIQQNSNLPTLNFNPGDEE